MAIMVYTQKNGFQEIPEPVQWLEGEDESSWMTKLGFKSFPLTVDGEDGYNLKVFVRAKDAKIEWEYLVSIWDACMGDYILVRSRADLLALRVAVAPLILLEAHNALDDLRAIARKAFQAWHGHSGLPGHFCGRCDPEQMKSVQEARARKARQSPAPKPPALKSPTRKPRPPKSTKPN